MQNFNITYVRLVGSYGGDNYETEFLSKIKNVGISVQEISEKRRGGILSTWGLLKLIFRFNLYGAGKLSRPFGFPIYSKDMILIFHDLGGRFDKWYMKLLYRFDFHVLKIFKNKLNIRVICVSKFWEKYLSSIDFKVLTVLYNDIKIPPFIHNSHTKKYISKKYGLNLQKRWCFLGGYQDKKGGKQLLNHLPEKILTTHEFVFTGFSKVENQGKVVWFELEDYFLFLKSCDIVVASSQFNEGWCRIVHEAILLGVPVIGNGAGGMKELLEKTNLPVFDKFPNLIKALQNRSRPIGNAIKLKKYIKNHNKAALLSIKNVILSE